MCVTWREKRERVKVTQKFFAFSTRIRNLKSIKSTRTLQKPRLLRFCCFSSFSLPPPPVLSLSRNERLKPFAEAFVHRSPPPSQPETRKLFHWVVVLLLFSHFVYDLCRVNHPFLGLEILRPVLWFSVKWHAISCLSVETH